MLIILLWYINNIKNYNLKFEIFQNLVNKITSSVMHLKPDYIDESKQKTIKKKNKLVQIYILF